MREELYASNEGRPSGRPIWSTNVFNCSVSSWHLGHSLAPRTELVPILLTREEKVPAYVSYFVLYYYAPCSPSSNHIGFHCIPQTHQAPSPFRADIITILYPSGHPNLTLNQFLTRLSLSSYSHICSNVTTSSIPG